MLKYVEVPELFKVLAEMAAGLREKEYGPPCLDTACPRRQTKCGEPSNVIPFPRSR